MKKKLRYIVYLLFFVLLIGLFVYYCTHNALTNYTLTKVNYSSSAIPEAFEDFKIAFLSDIDLKNEKDIERFKKICEKVNQQNPNLVLFGGDLFEADMILNEQVHEALKSLRTTHGKFAVLGEKDFSSLNECIQLIENAGFEVLRNKKQMIYYQDASIELYGLESSGQIAQLNPITSSFKVVLVHEPDYFQETSLNTHVLQLSGHSHGGYIYLPILGSNHKITGASTYNHGHYQLNGNDLYISNGIGHESEQTARFMTTPEVLIFTLKHDYQQAKPQNQENPDTQNAQS